MTKEELRDGFKKGLSLEEMLTLCPGQDCTIFKADKFCTDDQVIYIPDLELNNITATKSPYEEDAEYTINRCYTGEDFVDLCEGDEALAYRLFCYCDWQHPSSALPEVDYDDEEDKKWAEEMYASFKSTKACTTSTMTISTNTGE